MKRNVLTLLVFGVLLMALPLKAQEKLKFSTMSGSMTADITANIIKEAYKRIGIGAEIIKVPAERALSLSNSGQVDGEVFRIAGIDKKYTNLIQISVPIFIADNYLFTKHLDFTVKGWESLKPYKVGIRRGVKFAEEGTKEMDRQIVNDYHSLFTILDKLEFRQRIPNVNTTGSKNHLSKRLFRQQV